MSHSGPGPPLDDPPARPALDHDVDVVEPARRGQRPSRRAGPCGHEHERQRRRPRSPRRPSGARAPLTLLSCRSSSLRWTSSARRLIATSASPTTVDAAARRRARARSAGPRRQDVQRRASCGSRRRRSGSNASPTGIVGRTLRPSPRRSRRAPRRRDGAAPRRQGAPRSAAVQRLGGADASPPARRRRRTAARTRVCAPASGIGSAADPQRQLTVLAAAELGRPASWTQRGGDDRRHPRSSRRRRA